MKLLVQIVYLSQHLISLKDEIYINLADLFNLFFRSVILLSKLKRDHPSSTYQKLSGKLKFLTPDRHTYICVLRDKKFMFLENFEYVPDGWPQTAKTAKNSSSFQIRWIIAIAAKFLFHQILIRYWKHLRAQDCVLFLLKRTYYHN